ncbi:MAG TPA: hypothetical protein VMZ49_06095 [Patescibacteria group bacterium]|nr:hypothetical protein [Patescibacteria group bacterium]
MNGISPKDPDVEVPGAYCFFLIPITVGMLQPVADGGESGDLRGPALADLYSHPDRAQQHSWENRKPRHGGDKS